MPFIPPAQNQAYTQRCNTPTPQQGILPDPRFGNPPSVQSPCAYCSHHNPLSSNNFSQIPVQQHSLNHQFLSPMLDNRNAHFNNLQGNPLTMPHRAPSIASGFPNFVNQWPMVDPSQHNHLLMQMLGSAVPSHLVLQNGISQPSNQQLARFSSYQNNQTQLHNQTMLPQQLGQFCSHNQPQILNQIMPMLPHGQICSHSQPQIFHPIMHPPFSQHSIGPTPTVLANHPPCSHSQNVAPTAHAFNPTNTGYYPNQTLHPHESQNCTAIENSHLGHGMAISNAQQLNAQDPHMFIQPNNGQNAVRGVTTVAQPQQGNKFFPHDHGPMQVHQTQRNSQPGGPSNSQENSVADGAKHNISNINQNNSAGNNFKRNLHGPWKNDLTCVRFQKSPLHHIRNTKGNFKPDKRNGKKSHAFGQHKQGGRISNLGNACGQAGPDCKRPSVLLSYTEEEIQQWREERKKHFPTKAKIEKLTERHMGEAVDVDLKTRRQQLKEILAKQVELGVEVAELPPNYLSESENVSGRKLEKKGGRFKRKFTKRGKRRPVNRHEKVQNFQDKDSPVSVLSERSPTLLQKLLSADIKRDKSHLLQVFRFMVMNFFFKESSEKPLNFPIVTVRGVGSKPELVEEKCEDEEEEEEEEETVVFESSDRSFIKEKVLESEKEEGEIID